MEKLNRARYIVETLAKNGFVAYYAGGWVRDYLLDHPSDDIDIATNAPPETIQALFPKTVPIGISFGIILVVIEDHPYEVATFRQDMNYHDGRRPSRIEFTTAQEDAKRRDFTINGMFYDPLREEILDFVGGKEDLEKKIIRAIGNPHERIREDRLRMIRAIRLSCRFHFDIEQKTKDAIRAHVGELFPSVAIERVVQELEKGRIFGKLRPMLISLHEFGLLEQIFPSVKDTSIEEIKKRVDPIGHFPIHAPFIACIMELFLEIDEEQLKILCKKLKLPNSELDFALFLLHTKQFLKQKDLKRIDWAYFYANSHSTLALQILSSHLDEEKRLLFFKEHEEKIQSLQSAISNLQNKTPIIRSSDLVQQGILPGKQMGILLKIAEAIAINEQIEDKDLILERLKQHPAWLK